MSAEAQVRALSDADLTGRILAGDRAAESELDRRWRPRLIGVAWEILRARDLAEDAAQIAFWRAIPNLAWYDRARPFEKWILALGRNSARDLARQRRARPVMGGAEVLEGVADHRRENADPAAKEEELDALRACIGTLRGRSRMVVGFHMAEFSLSEIGSLLGVAKSTVQGWLQAAPDQLHRCMAGRGFSEAC